MLRGQKHDFVVHCDLCDVSMYRVRGGRLTSVSIDRMTIQPVAITLSRKRELIFCGQRCTVLWFEEAGPYEVLGGYPLFWGATPEPPLESRRPLDEPEDAR